MIDGSKNRRLEQERLREQLILRAAIEELAQADYGGLTVERVAARAGVNKTTVYRKWETKADLIRAALFSVLDSFPVGASAGDLRTDLLRICASALEFIRSADGQSLMRLRLLQQPEPELAVIAKEINERRLVELRDIVQSAVARGELSPDVDVLLLLDMLWGALHARVVMKGEVVDNAMLERLVDLLMRGAQPRPKSRKPAPKKRGRIKR
ncbi:MAG: hypothetical protein RL701_6528 [Pseudomonadota bacterium]|jgi:AcrR family transcriptional regulator